MQKTRLVALTALALLACTTEPKVVESPTQPSASSSVAVVPVDAGYDWSPVAQPKSVFLTVRAVRPRETLDTIKKLGKLSRGLDAMLEEESKGVTAYVDYAEPADLVIAFDGSMRSAKDPKIFVGFAVPLKSSFDGLLDLMQKEGDEVRREGKVVRVRSKELSCQIAVPDGRAPRLVCGDSLSAFRELGPFMERTLPVAQKPASDLLVSVDFNAVNEAVLPLIRSTVDEGLGDARRGLQSLGITDPELLDAPSGAARELVAFLEELNKAELSIAVSGNDAVVQGEVTFKEQKSWPTRVLTAKNGIVTAPPDVFWRLPKDADSAAFGHATDPIEFAAIRRVFKKGVLAGLGFTDLSSADQAAVGTLIDSIPSTLGATYAYASGPLASAAPAAGKTFTPDDAIKEAQRRFRSFIGWTVITGEGDVAQMSSFMKNGADVYSRVTKHLRAKKSIQASTSVPKLLVVDNPPGLPKGSRALDLSISITSEDVWSEMHPVRSWDTRPPHPKGAGKKGTLDLRLAAVPNEGGGYLWGFSADPNVLKAKLNDSQKSAKPELQLGSRGDLAPLRKPAHSAGFFAPGRGLRDLLSVDPNDRDTREVLELMDAMPNRGRGLVFYKAGGAKGPAPSVVLEFRAGKDWVEDLSAALSKIAQGK